MNTKLIFAFKSWLPIAITATLMSGLVYIAVQQNYRMSANDPQVQLAQDVTTGLSNGRKIGSFDQQEDMTKSLAPFIIVYDDKGNPLASSVILNGKVPQISQVIMNYVRVHGEERLTWEPQSGVRSAIIVTKYNSTTASGFVLAGRSLREIEQRENMLAIYVILGWILSLVLSFISIVLLNLLSKYSIKSSE